jgi:hypothetical protein
MSKTAVLLCIVAISASLGTTEAFVEIRPYNGSPTIIPKSASSASRSAAVAIMPIASIRRNSVRLTTKEEVLGGDDEERRINVFQKAKRKFQARPGTYLTIPVIAALVGWLTNYLAVQMIFYPIQYWGIPLWRRPEVPLGIIGWQGIIPAVSRGRPAFCCSVLKFHDYPKENLFLKENKNDEHCLGRYGHVSALDGQ